MPIYRESQIGSILPAVNEVVLIEKNPVPLINGNSVNGVGVVVQGTKGNTDEIYIVNSMSEYINALGDYITGLDDYLFVQNYFSGGGANLHVVRVASSGTATASVTLTGQSTTGNVVTFSYDSFGTQGNNATVTITNSSVTGYVDLLFREGKNTLSYQKVTTDISDTARYMKTVIDQDVNSFIDVTMVLTDGTLPATGTFSLSGGSNGVLTGASLPDSAYVGTETSNGRTGIELLETTDEITTVICPRSSSTVHTALISHVGDLSLSPRRTIIALPSGTSIDSAVTAMDLIDDDRVQVLYNWVKITNPFTFETQLVNPVAFKASYDVVLSYEQSASQRRLPAVVIGVERVLTNNDVNRLALKRINPIRKQRGAGIVFEKDISSSSEPAREQWSVRKAKDYFALSIEDGLKPFVSRPITPELFAQISSSLSAFLELEARARKIGRSDGSKPYSVLCNSSNNTQSTIQRNRVIVDVEISLLGLADKIFVYLDSGIDKTIVNTN